MPAVPEEGLPKKGLAFDEETKLVYGVIFSLRNMVKKMAGRSAIYSWHVRYLLKRYTCYREEPFLAYKTSAYKLHFFESPSGFKFVLLSDPLIDSLRFLLRQIYQTAFQDHVVRNPFIQLDSRVSKRGLDNDAFRNAIDIIISSVTT